MPLRLADPLGGYGAFLELLGCEPRGTVTEHFGAFTLGEGGHGLVGIHPPMDPVSVGAGALLLERPGAAYLSFETTEDLDQVAERLERAGFPATVAHRAHVGEVLSVSDADGLRLEVHVTPSAR
jgi:hypothetical protein